MLIHCALLILDIRIVPLKITHIYLFIYLLMCVCSCNCMHMYWSRCVCGSQRTTNGRSFSVFSMWVLQTEFRLSSFVEGACTGRVILEAHCG